MAKFAKNCINIILLFIHILTDFDGFFFRGFTVQNNRKIGLYKKKNFRKTKRDERETDVDF